MIFFSNPKIIFFKGLFYPFSLFIFPDRSFYNFLHFNSIIKLLPLYHFMLRYYIYYY